MKNIILICLTIVISSVQLFAQSKFVDASGTQTDSSSADNPYVKKSAILGASNWIPRFSGTNSLTNSIIYQLGNSIGIGTTNPYGQFSNTNLALTGSNGLGFGVNGFTWAGLPSTWLGGFYSGNTSGHGVFVKTAGNTIGTIAFEVGTATTASTSSTPLLNVFGNGYIGLGLNASPSARIHIKSRDTFSTNQTYTGTAMDGGGIHMYTNSGNDGGNQTTFSRVLDIVSGSTVSGTAGAGVIRFLTNTNAEGASAAMGEKMRIHSNGNVGIGTIYPQYSLELSKSSGPTSFLIGTPGIASTDQVTINMATKYNQTTALGTSSNKGYQLGARGDAWSTGVLKNSLFISHWDGSAWFNRITLGASGTVGIGSYATAPATSTLEVDGSATNKIAFFNSTAPTTVDFSKSNLAYTSASAGTFTINGMKDGGTYTLAVQGATSGTSYFTGTDAATGGTLVFKSINNGATIANKHTLYTFIVMSSTVYYYMATGF